jgi:hypothetical protein
MREELLQGAERVFMDDNMAPPEGLEELLDAFLDAAPGILDGYPTDRALLLFMVFITGVTAGERRILAQLSRDTLQ